MCKQFGKSLLALCLVATTMALPTNENQMALQKVEQGTNEFSTNFFKAVSAQQPGNLITSPLSADVVLAMVSAGAEGNTLAQFNNALRLPQPESLSTSGYQSLIDNFNNVKNVQLSLANKVFINKDFTVKPTFEEVTGTYFRSSAEKVDFSNAALAASTINSWCEQQTNNRIKDLVNPSDVDSSTAMVLVNAVYFKGTWKHQFNAEHTTPRAFHVDANTVKNVPTMYIKDDLKYGVLPGMKASFVEIPYTGDDLSMVIVLPDEVDGLSGVIDKMQSNTLAEVLQTTGKHEVKLYLPKFKIESKIELNEILKGLGMTDMYTSQANFSRISDVPLGVSKAVQKAFIEVNEEGSEAAAATAMGIMLCSLVYPEEVMVDRPFAYAIVKTGRGEQDSISEMVPLFVGTVVNPTA